MKRAPYIAGIVALALFIAASLYGISSSDTAYPRNLLNSVWQHEQNTSKGLSHNEVFSVTSPDRAYFDIDFGDQHAMNPNILPHPYMEETWIVVAQLVQEGLFFAEVACNAKFENGTLRCTKHATALPIAPTQGDLCTGDLSFLGLNQGPHDARVFYGPKFPYTIYGSQSKYACFGQWVQDFRMLVEWGYDQFDSSEFAKATDLQRPLPYGDMEKNWFLFFDHDDQAYLHYDVFPKRSFAKVDSTGSVGTDLATLTAAHDDKCIAKYMPKLGPELESIHQATNALSVTTCRRSDSHCKPSADNTFTFTIFQHKTYFNFHAVYEPYVMVFESRAPFQLQGISEKPVWIHGRKGGSNKDGFEQSEQDDQQEEMIYITSMSWKTNGQKYHGYIDDVLFLAFGVEDRQAAGIDVVAGDLLRDLGKC